MQGGADAVHQGHIVPGLGDEVEGPEAHALHGEADAAPGRHEDDGGRRGEYLDLAQQLQVRPERFRRKVRDALMASSSSIISIITLQI